MICKHRNTAMFCAWCQDQQELREARERIAAQDVELDAVLKDRIALALKVEELKDDLQFVERWANHHGQKPRVTAQEALSCIQHYPSIIAITKSYADGKVPETFDPYAEIARLREALQFYADKVSGKPQNLWCDEASTAVVENGAIARAALTLTPKEPS